MAGESKATGQGGIKQLVGAGGGCLAVVRNTARGERIGVLPIGSSNYWGEEILEIITWEDFFEQFEDRRLSLFYEIKIREGDEIQFCKLVSGEDRKQALFPSLR
jgi:hypothetical protein